MGTQQDGPSHDEYGGEPVKTDQRFYISDVHTKMDFPLIHVFIETDFSYGYLHTWCEDG